ncbi:MAG: ParB/RepB/Spo0J family partition protein [Actinomycetota bacterium]
MTVRGGLGKGLGELIPAGARAYEELPAGSIVPNPAQPRRTFDDGALAGLAASIKQVGLLQPVVVRPRGDGTFELIMGERRWRASRRAGLATIPALIVEADDRGALERAMIENVHREDLNAIEEAAGYQQLIDEAGMTHERLAEKLGLSRPAISNALRLLELPDEIRRWVIEGRLSAGHGRALLGMGGHPLQERIAQRVMAEGLTVRATEDLVRSQRIDLTGRENVGQTPRDGRGSVPPGVVELQDRLSETLSTIVSISYGKGKGKIVIRYGSDEDLQRIADQISPTGADGYR